MIKHIAVIILLFFYIFGVSFSFIPLNTSKVVFLYLIIIYIISFFNKQNNFLKINKDIYYISIFLIILLLLSILYTTFHSTGDFAIAYAYFIMLSETLVGIYLFYKLYLYKYNFKGILNLFVWISLLQSIIIIMMLVSEPFRELINSITNKDITDLVERYGGFRGFGLAGSVTYDLAVFLSISMMFITYLISYDKTKRYFYISSWIIIFIAVLMTGRSGWLGAFLSLVILFFSVKNKNALKSIAILFLLIFTFIFLIVFILSNYYPETYEVLILKIIPYAFEMFFNLYETGSMTTHSIEILNHMYFPIEIKTFFLGDGYFSNPNGFGYYMGTDAGYMRQILFYGLLPSSILYILYIFLFYKLYLYTKIYKNAWLLVYMMAGYYFLMQYKGTFLTGSSMNIKLVFLLLVFSIFTFKNNYKVVKNV
jgi:hypothetical protein